MKQHYLFCSNLFPQELHRISESLTSVNSTVYDVKQYQQGFDARLTLLEAIDIGNPSTQHKDETITPHMMHVFTQIHSDVNTLVSIGI